MIEEIRETLSSKYFPTGKHEDGLKSEEMLELSEKFSSIAEKVRKFSEGIGKYEISIRLGRGLPASCPMICIHWKNPRFDSSVMTGIFLALIWKVDGEGLSISLELGREYVLGSTFEEKKRKYHRLLGSSGIEFNMDRSREGVEMSSLAEIEFNLSELESFEDELTKQFKRYKALYEDEANLSKVPDTFNLEEMEPVGEEYVSDTSVIRDIQIRFSLGRLRKKKIHVPGPVEVCLRTGKGFEGAGFEKLWRMNFRAEGEVILRFDLREEPGKSLEEKVDRQLAELSDCFLLCDKDTEVSIKMVEAKRWLEDNEDYLIIYDSPDGFNENSYKDFLPKTHDDYFLLTYVKEEGGLGSDHPFQFQFFAQLILFRLLLTEKSEIGESRSWESFFDEGFLDLKTWTKGSWKWDDPKIQKMAGRIYGDAIGRLAGLDEEENAKIASIIRKNSFSLSDWVYAVPGFLSSLLSVERFWSKLEEANPEFVIQRIRNEKHAVMERDSWPYSEKMGDFVRYLPEDADFKEIVANLETHRRKRTKGYSEYEELCKKEQEFSQRQELMAGEEYDLSDDSLQKDRRCTLFLDLTVFSDANTIRIANLFWMRIDPFGNCLSEGNLYVRQKTDVQFPRKVLEEDENSWSAAIEELGNEILLSEDVCVLDNKAGEILRDELLAERHPVYFILNSRLLERTPKGPSSLSFLQYRDQRKFRIIRQRPTFLEKRKKEILKFYEEHKYRWGRSHDSLASAVYDELYSNNSHVLEKKNFEALSELLNGGLKEKRASNKYEIAVYPYWESSRFWNEFERRGRELKALDHLANCKDHEVVLDPSAGQGDLIHCFSYFNKKGSGPLPASYLAVSHSHESHEHSMCELASILLERSSDAPIEHEIISGDSIDGKKKHWPSHDLIVSNLHKDTDQGSETGESGVILAALNDKARALCFISEFNNELEHYAHNLLSSDALRLIVFGPGILYLDKGNATGTTNFLVLETVEDFRTFFKLDPECLIQPLDECSKYATDPKFKGLRLWTERTEDLLTSVVREKKLLRQHGGGTREFTTVRTDLSLERWEPREAKVTTIADSEERKTPSEHAKALREEIGKDLGVLEEVEKLQSELPAFAQEEMTLGELFQINHAKEFYGKQKNLSDEEKERLSNIDEQGHGMYGTGFDFNLSVGSPKILDFKENFQFANPGIALVLGRPKGEEGRYFLSNPMITCPNWSADRSVVALCPHQPMDADQLEFYRIWFVAVAREWELGLSRDFSGLRQLLSMQRIPVLSNKLHVEIIIEISKKLNELHSRRDKGSNIRYREYMKSIFGAMNYKA
jgi:hypothetical protein